MLDHTDGIQLVAVVASLSGLILTLAALFVRGRAATTVVIMLLFLSATGLFGAYEHFENRAGERSATQRQLPAGNQLVAYYQDDQDKPVEGSEEATPPPLAPLSLAGLSLVAAISVIGGPRKE
jgi:hypothetical protein